MSQLLFFIIGFAVGAFLIYAFKYCNCKKCECQDFEKDSSHKSQIDQKEENKRSVLNLLERQHKITNNDVEKMLGISDATAERYLQELEEEGKLKQVGETGSAVYYEKK